MEAVERALRVQQALDRLKPSELVVLAVHIKQALEGDSNDAEHDALAEVAEAMDIEWEAPE